MGKRCVCFLNGFPIASVSFIVDVHNLFANAAIVNCQMAATQTEFRKLVLVYVGVVSAVFPRIFLTAFGAVFGNSVAVVAGFTKELVGALPVVGRGAIVVCIAENFFVFYNVDNRFGYFLFAAGFTLGDRALYLFGSAAALALVDLIAVNAFNRVPAALVISINVYYSIANFAILFAYVAATQTKLTKLHLLHLAGVTVSFPSILHTASSAHSSYHVAVIAGFAILFVRIFDCMICVDASEFGAVNFLAVYNINVGLGCCVLAVFILFGGEGFILFGCLAVFAGVDLIAVNLFTTYPVAIVIHLGIGLFTNGAASFIDPTAAQTELAKVNFVIFPFVRILGARGLIAALGAGFGVFVTFLAGFAKQLVGVFPFVLLFKGVLLGGRIVIEIYGCGIIAELYIFECQGEELCGDGHHTFITGCHDDVFGFAAFVRYVKASADLLNLEDLIGIGINHKEDYGAAGIIVIGEEVNLIFIFLLENLYGVVEPTVTVGIDTSGKNGVKVCVLYPYGVIAAYVFLSLEEEDTLFGPSVTVNAEAFFLFNVLGNRRKRCASDIRILS